MGEKKNSALMDHNCCNMGISDICPLRHTLQNEEKQSGTRIKEKLKKSICQTLNVLTRTNDAQKRGCP